MSIFGTNTTFTKRTRQMSSYDVAVVGAGAAGLFAAGTLAQQGLSVALIEHQKPASKVKITGKGRCNLTNNCDAAEVLENVVTNRRFLYSALSGFAPEDTMQLMTALGVQLKTERGRRVFPQSDSSLDVARALTEHARGARLIKGEAAALLMRGGSVMGVRLKDGSDVPARAVLLACGGLSYPETGSDGSGWVLARQAGHSIIDPVPSLCGIRCGEAFCRELQGLTLKNVELVCGIKGGRELFRQRGELLFTECGISGPLALTLSAHINRTSPDTLYMYIDLKPALAESALDARLLRDFSENINREFKNSLDALLPRSLAPVIVRLSSIPPECRVNSVTAGQRAALVSLLKRLPLTVLSLEEIERAVVTSGGVDTAQIQPKTMASRLARGLFFAGEIIDVDALTGGYNLQLAFSTAMAAAKGITQYCRELSEEQ